jgi:hypothetical protein
MRGLSPARAAARDEQEHDLPEEGSRRRGVDLPSGPTETTTATPTWALLPGRRRGYESRRTLPACFPGNCVRMTGLYGPLRPSATLRSWQRSGNGESRPRAASHADRIDERAGPVAHWTRGTTVLEARSSFTSLCVRLRREEQRVRASP